VPLTSATNAGAAGAEPSIELHPTVANMGSLGVRITVAASSRSTASASPQSLGEEFVILAPDANFGDVDNKLSDFGLRVAKRVAEPSTPAQVGANPRFPHGIVGFYCVLPPDLDPQLNRLARTLTIELPYRLSQAAQAKGVDLTLRGLDLKETIGTCDPNSGLRSAPFSSDRIENFSWTGSLSRDPSLDNKTTLTLRFRDANGGGNFRPLPPVIIENMESPGLGTIAEKLIDNFVQAYQNSQYRLFVHFESDALRKALEQKVVKALTDNGYNVVGGDLPPTPLSASWIDFFFPEDCRGATEIRRTLLPILQASTTNASSVAPQDVPLSATLPYVKASTATQRPATIGIWLSTKQISSPPNIECAK
jgi:hypothetical protein